MIVSHNVAVCADDYEAGKSFSSVLCLFLNIFLFFFIFTLEEREIKVSLNTLYRTFHFYRINPSNIHISISNISNHSIQTCMLFSPIEIPHTPHSHITVLTYITFQL